MGWNKYNIIGFIRKNGFINTMNLDHKKAVGAPMAARKEGRSLSYHCRQLWLAGKLEGVRVKGKSGWNYYTTRP